MKTHYVNLVLIPVFSLAMYHSLLLATPPLYLNAVIVVESLSWFLESRIRAKDIELAQHLNLWEKPRDTTLSAKATGQSPQEPPIMARR